MITSTVLWIQSSTEVGFKELQKFSVLTAHVFSSKNKEIKMMIN